MSFRRPQKTPLQRGLRQAERSVSGALFLLLAAGRPEQKVELRARFVSGVCRLLIERKVLTMLQAEKQLNQVQLEFLRGLFQGASAWGDWLAGRDPSVEATLSGWLQLGANYVAGVLRDEPSPPAVDWGQREQELSAQFSSSPGKVEIDLEEGFVRLVKNRSVLAESQAQVLGTYRFEQRNYLSGWSDPQVSQRARPLPVFGCASQLFRLELVEARSEAHRAAWLAGIRYVFEHRRGQDVVFLGLDRPEKPATGSVYEKKDLAPEMISRVETLLRASEHYEPDRMRSLLRSQGQEVERLLPLVNPSSSIHSLMLGTAEALNGLSTRVSTHNLLGVRRSDLSRKDQEMMETELSEIRLSWDDENKG